MKHLPIGEQIRAYRKKRKLSQKQLANLASCSMDYISMLERGLYYPNVRILMQIAQALEIPVAKLVEETSVSLLPKSAYQRVWALADFQEDFDRLDQRRQMLLIEILRYYCQTNTTD